MFDGLGCGLKSLAELTLKQGRRLVAIVLGVTLLLIGILLLFTPGPGMVIIYAGIGVLATELIWARRLLSQIKKRIAALGEVLNNRTQRSRAPQGGTDAALAVSSNTSPPRAETPANDGVPASGPPTGESSGGADSAGYLTS